MPIDESNLLQLCLKEIEVAQATIARYDSNGSNIKSWCVTTWSAISAYALTQRDPAIALLGLAIIFGFGHLELTYRRFQKRFIRRAAEIEELLGCGQLEEYKYSIDKTANAKGKREIRSVFRLPHFTFFYATFIVFSLAVILYCWMYPLEDSSFYLRLPIS